MAILKGNIPHLDRIFAGIFLSNICIQKDASTSRTGDIFTRQRRDPDIYIAEAEAYNRWPLVKIIFLSSSSSN